MYESAAVKSGGMGLPLIFWVLCNKQTQDRHLHRVSGRDRDMPNVAQSASLMMFRSISSLTSVMQDVGPVLRHGKPTPPPLRTIPLISEVNSEQNRRLDSRCSRRSIRPTVADVARSEGGGAGEPPDLESRVSLTATSCVEGFNRWA